jgi:hypothetical protein
LRGHGATSQAVSAARQLFDRARFAVVSGEALERGYKIAPDPKVPLDFAVTAAELRGCDNFLLARLDTWD